MRNFSLAIPAALSICLLSACTTTTETPVRSAAPLTSGAAAQALYSQWFVPQSAQTSAAANQLQQRMHNYCAGKADITAVRTQFVQTSQQWDRLSTLAMGPQIERRTARMVDFQPMRMPLLKSALRKAPKDLAAMETIGAPAKGLPAAEYLLWTEVAQPHTPQCHYATLVTADIAQELLALYQANQAAAQDSPLDFESNAEFLNQWIGGLERLRWQSMEKPLRSATASKPAQLTRASSQGTLQSWQAQWAALQQLAIGMPQQPHHVSITALVEARGWSHLAQALRTATQQADAAMRAVTAPDLQAIAPASEALRQLKHLVETDVAMALDISIGFSDADGD